jgi:exodeoxyribonuclease V
MIFTKCQEAALLNIEKFLKDDDEYVFILEGSAGTGKTTVITTFQKKRKDLKVVFTAPTHKAVKVLKNMGKEPSNLPFYDKDNYQTLHKFFKLKIEYKQDGSPYLQINKCKNITNVSNLLLVIDEISMIPKDLYNIIIELVKELKIKTICLGDRCQLPPIYKLNACDDDDDDDNLDFKAIKAIEAIENKSLVLKDEAIKKISSISIEELSSFFIDSFKYYSKLTEIKRTTNEDLKKLYSIFRQYTLDEDTENLKSSLLVFKKMNISSYIKIVTSKNHFVKEVNENIEKKNAYIICSKRNSVKSYVENIKKKLFPESEYPFNVNEPIYITNYFEFSNNDNCSCMFNNRPSLFCNQNKFYTSEEYKIISCNKKPVYSEYFEEVFDCYEFEINYQLHNDTFLIVRKICENSQKLFDDIILKKKKEIKKIKVNSFLWKQFYIEKNYLNSPFTSSFAITAYKSQGSTYDYVFVDGNDIEECRRTTFLKSKELYTAVTRTRKNICIYIELEKDFKEIPNGLTRCIRCRCWRNQTHFKLNKKGFFIKTCVPCCDKAKLKRV